jgi:hypothetical protein
MALEILLRSVLGFMMHFPPPYALAVQCPNGHCDNYKPDTSSIRQLRLSNPQIGHNQVGASDGWQVRGFPLACTQEMLSNIFVWLHITKLHLLPTFPSCTHQIPAGHSVQTIRAAAADVCAQWRLWDIAPVMLSLC